jgi:hypothetical protein
MKNRLWQETSSKLRLHVATPGIGIGGLLVIENSLTVWLSSVLLK